MLKLPIDDVLPSLTAALTAHRAVVLEAPPGAGKTTRVPTALLSAGFADGGEIIVLEPRRLAARMASARVADELGERLGERVGYQVRFDEVASARTQIRFVTEGVLTRRLVRDPQLKGVAAVVLDEFHERHLQGDVALGLLRRLQLRHRPELALVAMSATLDGASVARFLGDCPRIVSEGRRFAVEIEHLPSADDRPLAAQIAEAVRRLCDEGLDGDVLVFVPGAAEIRRALDALGAVAEKYKLVALPLHGDLSPAEQDRAVKPADRRKVIVSTNVAETSITIDGVVAVIDSGLARVASHAAWSGLPMLDVKKVSRASATQRAGRAGRTRPGRCLRLYTRHDHDTRPEHDAPEVRRLDLAETALELHAAGERDLSQFGWFEAPPAQSLDAAERLLAALGAITPEAALTPLGRRLLRYPVHPRLARLLVEARDRHVAESGATLAALLSERDIVAARRGAGLGPQQRGDDETDSDIDAAMHRFAEAREAQFDAATLRALGLDTGATLAVERVRKQLSRSLAQDRSDPNELKSSGTADEALRLSVLAAWPDRVARKLRGVEYAFASGGKARLAGAHPAQAPEFVVAVEAEEKTDARQRGVVIRRSSYVEAEWLLELFPDEIEEVTEARWVAAEARVEVWQRLLFRGLELDASRAPPGEAADRAATERLLAEALARGPRSFVENEENFDRWMARHRYAAEVVRGPDLPPPDEAALAAALRRLCEGARSMAEVRAGHLLQALQESLSPAQRKRIDALAPDRVTLPGGKVARVEYPETGAAPFIASRLQDFFGMREGPRVGGGPLTLHLLAPNHRAVQVTTDLAGFWERHYPAIRKELCRQYPRHLWPEDGRTATPPPNGRVR
ncbi:MAG: ATP-dependent helicase HrpB [Myxococcales bacterium]|nr:ATP-dependent helicase HrpB [Myxococcales bacterium]